MFEGEQHAPGLKGCSFYKVLFLLVKGANNISFIFTLLRGSMICTRDGYLNSGSRGGSTVPMPQGPVSLN